ncbi:MAG: hypothetical protein IID18_10385 [Nitrospinae bacterium]|nr:hypothetical protein [Nitrospinota bacterium]
MTRLETIESTIGKVPCPVCLNARLSVGLSCDTSHSPCDFRATCGHCQHAFIVSDDPKTMEDIWINLEKKIGSGGCPRCGDDELHLDFLCDVGSEDCFFLIKCGSNGHFSKLDHSGLKYLFT